MKVSLIITVFNEEKTIGKLLRSLGNQTLRPDEIIFVDGGSKDRTVQLIKAEARRNENIKLIIKKGASIAQGRNIGIKAARGEIIAMTDAGCVAHKDWLEKITQPFKDSSIGIVAGFYKMTGKTPFQQAIAPYLGIPPEKFNAKNFLPSARSIAFRKEIWEKIGGFNEKLERTGEDTLFNYQAKKLGVKFAFAPDALVDWEMPKTLSEAMKKFYVYAKGDGQAGIWWHPSQRLSTHNLKISAIYTRYFLGLGLLIAGFFNQIFWWPLFLGFIAYLLWAIFKNSKYVSKKALLWLPALQIISDLAVMAGFLKGVLNGVEENPL